MPVALDPSERFEYVISTDRSKSKDEQPTFIFHYPTCRERKQMAALFDEADKSETVSQMIDKTCEGIRLVLVGWRNIKDRNGNGVAFDPAELDAVISDTDLTELRIRLPSEMDGSELEKKAFVLRPRLASEPPANAATPVTA